jgi:peptide/nickel transport system permease protein
MPGDPVTILAGEYEPPPELRASIEATYGLDKPLYIQYILFIGEALKFNLGRSIIYGKPVIDVILERIPATSLLLVAAIFWSSIFGVLFPLATIKFHGKKVEGLFNVLAVCGYSIPVFWLGQILVLVFSYWLNFFPSYGITSVGQMTGFELAKDIAQHLFLPAITLGAVEFSILARTGRIRLLEELSESYVITARSKGLSFRTILLRHVFRNVLTTIVTLIGHRLAYFISLSMIVEVVFAWPGLGSLLVTSIFRRDYSTILGVFYFYTLIVIIASIITDLLYSKIDPRVKMR